MTDSLPTTRDIDEELLGSQQAKPEVGKYFVLCIAIDHYPAGIGKEPLGNPVHDVSQLLRVLSQNYDMGIPPEGTRDLREDDRYTDHEEPIWAYDTVEVRTLFNEDATYTKIASALQEIYEKIGREDACLIYFAGHGKTIEIGPQKKGKAVFFPEDNRPTGEADFNEVFGYFDMTDKCMDFLMVLDCCFAGSINIGNQGGISPANGFLSRYALLSSGSDKKALDGEQWQGSPFSNALCRTLSERVGDLSFTDKTMAAIQEKVTPLIERSGIKPKEADGLISHERLPVQAHGIGKFVFRIRKSQKPAVADLSLNLIDNLDFRSQRIELEAYLPQLDHLNILTTHGHSFDVQNVLKKVFFRQIKDKIKFEHGLLQFYNCVIDNAVSGTLWDTVRKQVDDAQAPIDKEAIVGWFFEKLNGVEPPYFGKKLALLSIGFKTGSDRMFEQIQEFCTDWVRIFQKKRAALGVGQRDQYGKLFLLFADERGQGNNFSQAFFEQMAENEHFNLIKTSSSGKLEKKDVELWLEALVTVRGDALRNLAPDRFLDLSALRPACRYEDLISKLCTHCGFSSEESQALSSSLYDEKNLIL
jgi:hypothetical protein